MSFTKLGLPASILKGVRAAGYSEPTPIQQRAIPIILTGDDLVGAAQTGTGKTAAFLLPILARLLDGVKALRCLILVPTRELAAQVETNARDYARFTPLRAGVVFGGVPHRTAGTHASARGRGPARRHAGPAARSAGAPEPEPR